MEYTNHYESPLGGITLASDGERLTGLWFDGQKHFGYTLGKEHEEKDLQVFADTSKWLKVYFSGKIPDFTPLHVNGSEFLKRVCRILLTIPYGKTRTYGDIARQIAGEDGREKMSSQAVGGAVGRNPISLIIPCYRLKTHPITREFFEIGNVKRYPKGYFITDLCIGCGTCQSVCPQQVITEGTPFVIDQHHCLQCGNCFENCPVQVIEWRGL